MINGQIFDEDYSIDSHITKNFFAAVQNKMHYAVHGNTVAEIIMARADHNKKDMGLTSWKKASNGKIVKADVSAAKNYLSVNEIQRQRNDYLKRFTHKLTAGDEYSVAERGFLQIYKLCENRL